MYCVGRSLSLKESRRSWRFLRSLLAQRCFGAQGRVFAGRRLTRRFRLLAKKLTVDGCLRAERGLWRFLAGTADAIRRRPWPWVEGEKSQWLRKRELRRWRLRLCTFNRQPRSRRCGRSRRQVGSRSRCVGWRALWTTKVSGEEAARCAASTTSPALSPKVAAKAAATVAVVTARARAPKVPLPALE